MSNRFSGKVVVIAGAAQGIGFGCASLVCWKALSPPRGLQRQKGSTRPKRSPPQVAKRTSFTAVGRLDGGVIVPVARLERILAQPFRQKSGAQFGAQLDKKPSRSVAIPTFVPSCETEVKE